ncbi:hypothetical protein [Vulgatibacter sp.]|uniref:hypothetical protein n=1 Tax=Vulgatibacter sp. TaxID=1971226 RepID=UPI0035630073
MPTLARSLLLAAALAACGDTAATGPSTPPGPWPAALAPPRCVLDAPQPAGTQRHELTAGWLHFGPCGHLVIDAQRLADPAATAIHTFRDEPGNVIFFAPTGEAVFLGSTTSPSLTLVDLATWTSRSLPVDDAATAGWVPRRDRTSSILWWCAEGLLLAKHRGAEPQVVSANVACDRRLGGARSAPVVVFADGAGTLHVADLEDGSVATTGMASDVDEGRSDLVHLSNDGRLLVHQAASTAGGIWRALSNVTVRDVATGLPLAFEDDRPFAEAPVTVLDATELGRGLVVQNGGGSALLRDLASPAPLFEEAKIFSIATDRVVAEEGQLVDGRPNFVWLDLRTGERTPIEVEGLFAATPSPGGSAWSFTSQGGELVHHPDHGWLEVDGWVRWLGDDGSFVATRTAVATPATWLADPTGTVQVTVPGTANELEEAGTTLIVGDRQALHRIDRTTGAAETLSAARRPWTLAADKSGGRVAWIETGATGDESLVVAPAPAGQSN